MEADIVTLHVPLTKNGPDATFHLFGKERLARMRPDSVLFNTSRGAVVDGSALKEVLQSRKMAFAVLDVWEGEPQIDVELLEDVLIGTPHIAGYSTEGKVNGAVMVYHAVCRHLGIEPRWSVEGKLPAPLHPEIIVKDGDDDVALRSVVRSAYAVRDDDARLRAMTTWAPPRRGEHFKLLRSTYPVRREFPAMAVRVPSSRAGLRRKLEALGFSVTTE